MPASVFVSYSHHDEIWKERLVSQLRVLALEGTLDVWDDRRIEAGDEWRAEIDRAITNASIAVLLISPDFLTSKFIRENELTSILHRRSGGLRVIPLITRPCAWQVVKVLQGLQARPRDGRPLSGGTEHQIDADLANLALEINALLSPDQAGNRPSDAPVPAPTQPPVKRTQSSIARTLLWVCLPSVLGGLLALAATYWYIPTSIAVQLFTRRLAFSVPGSERPNLLNANRRFTDLVVERCGAVTFDAASFRRVTADEGTAARAGNVSLACVDPSAKLGLTIAEPGLPAIGTLDQLRVPQGAVVVLDILAAPDPVITLDVSALPPFTVALHQPFILNADLVNVIEPRYPTDSVALYRAEATGSNNLMRFDTGRQGAVLVVTPADDDAADFFNDSLRVPVAGIQLQDEELNDSRLTSPLVKDGQLTYPDLPSKPAQPVPTNRFFVPGATSTMVLTQIRVADEKNALAVRFEGRLDQGGVVEGVEFVDGQSTARWTDLRVTLYDAVVYGPRWRLFASVVGWAMATGWVAYGRWRKPDA